MPAGWIHGEHGSQVLLSHRDASLAEAAFERLTRLTQPGCSSFQEWLLPVMAPFEQSLRDEDLELVTKHLPARGTV
jgi:hypothetical protein